MARGSTGVALVGLGIGLLGGGVGGFFLGQWAQRKALASGQVQALPPAPPAPPALPARPTGEAGPPGSLQGPPAPY